MWRFALRRLLSAVPVLFVVSIVSFLIMWIVPGDIAAEIAGTSATPEQVAQIRERLGIDRPVWEQAIDWYANLFQGDLGWSYLLNRSVTDAVLERLPVTLSLAGLALVLAVVMGMGLGILASVKHRTPADQAAMSLALIGLSVPDFWLGLMVAVTVWGLRRGPPGLPREVLSRILAYLVLLWIPFGFLTAYGPLGQGSGLALGLIGGACSGVSRMSNARSPMIAQREVEAPSKSKSIVTLAVRQPCG